jgi:hypothetical protein
MSKYGLAFEDVPKLGKCPKCGTTLARMWGEGWDWDHAICPARGCDYDVELDTMTGHDNDGTIYIMAKPNEEE